MGTKIAIWFFGAVVGAIVSVAVDVGFHEPFENVKWHIVKFFFPSIITFEITDVSGCTSVAPLIEDAKKEGISFSPEISIIRLCDTRRFQGTARRIVEDIATAFSECFYMDEHSKMQARFHAKQVCKAHFAIDPSTNNWVAHPNGVLLCFPNEKLISGPLADDEFPARLCPDDNLRRLGFPAN